MQTFIYLFQGVYVGHCRTVVSEEFTTAYGKFRTTTKPLSPALNDPSERIFISLEDLLKMSARSGRRDDASPCRYSA
jgi:hypothetical protein